MYVLFIFIHLCQQSQNQNCFCQNQSHFLMRRPQFRFQTSLKIFLRLLLNINLDNKNIKSPSSASTSKNSSALTGFDFFESFVSDFSVLRFRDFIDFIEVFFLGDKLSKSFRACSTASFRLEAISVIKSSKYNKLLQILRLRNHTCKTLNFIQFVNFSSPFNMSNYRF